MVLPACETSITPVRAAAQLVLHEALTLKDDEQSW